jgi:hypothetical protein
MTGCMAGSSGVRPKTLMPGQLRVGMATGLARNYTDDFAFAKPTGEEKRRTSPVWLYEVNAHYGLLRDLDIGLRLRPASVGGKVELLYQAVRERTLGIGIALGAGADGFFRPPEQISCVAGGCFNRRYGGLLVDIPVILSRHLWRRGILFAGGRYMHLFVWGDQRYRSQTGAFPRTIRDKSFNQWAAGWVVGMEIEVRWFRLLPQLSGATTRLPSGEMAHTFYPTLEVAGVF